MHHNKATVRFYRQHLVKFAEYYDTKLLAYITELTPNDLREFLLFLESTGHNQGG